MNLNDWLTATLACVTVALAILGILIAVMAIWGYFGIKREAKSIAENEVHKKIDAYLDSAGIRAKLEEEIRKRVEIEADRLFDDFSLSTAFPQQPDGPSNPVAAEYPKEAEKGKDDAAG